MTWETDRYLRTVKPSARILQWIDAITVVATLMLLAESRGIASQRMPAYWLLGGATAFTYALAANMSRLYTKWRGASLWPECSAVARAWALAIATLMLAGYLSKYGVYFSRIVIVFWLLGAPLIMILVRALLRYGLGTARRMGANQRRAIVVGSGPMASHAAGTILNRPEMGLQLVGVYSDTPQPLTIPNHAPVEIAGPTSDVLALARRRDVDHVYIAIDLAQTDAVKQLVADLSDTTANVYLVPDLFVSDLLHTRWTEFGDTSVISVYDSPLSGTAEAIKRTEDLVFASILVAALCLPLAAIALAVRATSPGPVIFRQRRYGMDGREIMIWKFRTMIVCDDGDTIIQATPDDRRFTRIGAFLRRTSLDELPQLFNVLQGRMSLVGPRPHAVAHNELYRTQVRGYMLRHKVRPGITGLAQIHGLRGPTETVDKMARRVEYDLRYIHEWSLGLDLWILLCTLFSPRTWRNAH